MASAVFAQYVDDAMQLQIQGQEKVHVVCHLLKGLYSTISPTASENGRNVVAFVEKHRREKDCFFLHVIARDSMPELVAALAGEKLQCEKTTFLGGQAASDATRKKSVIASPSMQQQPTSPKRKWSIRKKSQHTGSTSQPAPVVPLSFQVYECRVTTETLLFDALAQVGKGTQCLLPRDRGTLFVSNPMDTAEQRRDLHFAVNTLTTILSVYREKHDDREKELKERIFNEIVQTMSLPLVVFDLRIVGGDKDEEKGGEAVEPTEMTCTFCNHAFQRLVQKGVRVKTSPKDQQYEDESHNQFHTFLSNELVNAAIKSVFDKHGRDHHAKSAGGGGGSKIYREKCSGPLSSSIDGGNCCQLVTLEYAGDDLIPQSNYELDIYRVNGTRVGIVIRDISEKVEHLRLIEQASRAKIEFLAQIHHQLKTPLNAIDGNLQLLCRTEPLTDRQKDLMHRMRLAETSLMGSLQEVLDYAQLEQRKIVLHSETFAVRHVLESTMDVMQSAASANRTRLLYDIGLDVPSLIVADSWRLQQVLVNLVSNAINYTRDGIVTVEVVVADGQDELHSEDAADLLFSVHDTGKGVEESMVPMLFEPWASQNILFSSYFGNQRGTGLGLAICKELTQLMGGRVWLKETTCATRHNAANEELQTTTISPLKPSTAAATIKTGSVFCFSIPLKPGDETENLKLAAKELSTIKGKNVLITLPDDEFRRKFLKTLLTWGMRPTYCSTVEETRDYVTSDDYSFEAIVVGDLCTNCKGDGSEEAVNDNDDDAASTHELVKLAQWLTGVCPTVPLIGIGNATSSHDDACQRLFRKIVEKPAKVDVFFHLFVNLFSRKMTAPSPPNSPKRVSSAVALPLSATATVIGPMPSCLVVEDVAENEVVLVEMLEYLGCKNIAVARDGIQMLEYLNNDKKRRQCDVVFMDLLMPNMSGMEAVKIYRKTHKLGTRPFVVAVSATNLVTSEPANYEAAGMDSFLQKPLKLNQLRTLLETISTKINF